MSTIAWHEAYLHQLRRLAPGLPQFDTGGQVDIIHLVGDAIGGVELAHVAQFRCGAADFFQELVLGDFLDGQIP